MEIVFERLPQVIAKRARSRASHYADIQRGLWTKPVALGPQCSAWPKHEVDALQAARLRGCTEDEIRALVDELHQRRMEAQ